MPADGDGACEPQVEPLPSGAYRVTFTVAAEKFEADSIGRERAVPMDDLIDIRTGTNNVGEMAGVGRPRDITD